MSFYIPQEGISSIVLQIVVFQDQPNTNAECVLLSNQALRP